tara:strand:- start:88 stop:363 length:276 start_codon:yes stop_codon:yes gene_type:complete
MKMSKNSNDYYYNKINESIGKAIATFLFGKKFKKIVKTMSKEAKDDPEYKAALIDFVKSQKALKDTADSICDRKPYLPACKDRKTRKRHRK